ncbi:MAG: hypothetical protein ACOC17_04660 [Halanaerobium sp.]
MKKSNEEYIKELKNEMPQLEIYTQKEERIIYAHATYPVEYKWILQDHYKYLPDAVIVPETEAEIAELLAKAKQ